MLILQERLTHLINCTT